MRYPTDRRAITYHVLIGPPRTSVVQEYSIRRDGIASPASALRGTGDWLEVLGSSQTMRSCSSPVLSRLRRPLSSRQVAALTRDRRPSRQVKRSSRAVAVRFLSLRVRLLHRNGWKRQVDRRAVSPKRVLNHSHDLLERSHPEAGPRHMAKKTAWASRDDPSLRELAESRPPCERCHQTPEPVRLVSREQEFYGHPTDEWRDSPCLSIRRCQHESPMLRS